MHVTPVGGFEVVLLPALQKAGWFTARGCVVKWSRVFLVT